MYQKNTENGYIVSIVKGVSVGNITEAEYQAINDIIRNKPTAEQGFDYRLREELTWELVQLPEPEREDEETATEADYLASLAELGVE